MRISDWSSDVCSSDLHSYRARRIEGTAGADRRKRKGACRRNIARRQITDTGGREIKGPRALKMIGQGRAHSSLSVATQDRAAQGPATSLVAVANGGNTEGHRPFALRRTIDRWGKIGTDTTDISGLSRINT